MSLALCVLGVAFMGWGLMTAVSVLSSLSGESDLGVDLAAGGMAVGLILVGLLLFRWGRAVGTDPTPTRRKTTAGGCLGSVLGAVGLFLLCFQIIPAGEEQLSCLAFPFVGAAVGGGVGALAGWLSGAE